MKKLAGNTMKLAGKAAKGKGKLVQEDTSQAVPLPVPAAIKEALIGSPRNFGRPHNPPYAFKASVVNTQLKSKVTLPASSELGKFLGIVDPPRSAIPKLLSNFIKLHAKNPGMRKDRMLEQKLVSMLGWGRTIGIQDLAKLMSNN